MSRLRIFDHGAPEAPLLSTADPRTKAAVEAAIGLGFEQWDAASPVRPGRTVSRCQ